MGFGWMFLGGLFFCTGKAGSFDLLPDFIGYLLLIKGMNTAGKYCRDFDGVKKLGALGEAVSAVLFIMQGLDMLGSNGVFSPGVISAAYALNAAIRIVFIFFLLLAVKSLAVTTGAVKTHKRALMALVAFPVFAAGYFALEGVAYFGSHSDEIGSKLVAGALFCEIVYILLFCVALFSAYMWICVEGDENMEKKNNIRSPMDYYDRRREREKAEDEAHRREAAASAAGKTVAQMYGVKKKKKKR